jgi:hypothetical protein
VEGIFRLAGSEKRIKELKTAFDTPPRYGKGLDWTGYTVHDAANILRRYFNNLPEPIIPLGNYDPFRQPLRGHQAEAVGQIKDQSPSTGGFDPDAAVRTYQHHIKGLPSLNRQLLLYILDLLAVFAAKADVNKMTTHNLAAIFQPGILSHPQHDMSPQDYRLSQDVLIFLIDNQDHFLIGMEGTAVDEGTVKHIESGPSTPQARTPTTPGRNNSGIGRSASTTSSAAAESIRKYNGVRRNVSTSSKRSRHSGAVPSPITPAFATPTTSGVHRSNTLPSKRSPAINSPRFPREISGPSTPVAEEAKNPLTSPISAEAAAIIASLGPVSRQSVATPEPVAPQPQATTTAKSEPPSAPAIVPEVQAVPEAQQMPVASKPVEELPVATTIKRAQTTPPQRIEMPQAIPLAAIPQGRPPVLTPALDSIPGAFPLPSPGIIPPSQDVTPIATPAATSDLLPVHRPVTALRSPHLTPTRERSEFIEGPVDSGPTVEPSPATRTFTQILAKPSGSPSSEAKDGRKPNKLQKKRGLTSANPSAHSSTQSLTGADLGALSVGMTQLPLAQQSPLYPPQPMFAKGYSQASGSKDALPNYNDVESSRNSGSTLKPSMSPSASFRSHSTATEYSEAAEPLEETKETKEEKRIFWKVHKRGESRATPIASQTDLHGSVPGGDQSMSSFGSSSGWGGAAGSRRSLQYESHQNSDLSTAYGSPPDHDKPEKKASPFDWFHKMRNDHKERSDKRERAKSPPGSSSLLAAPQNLRAPQDNPNGRGRSTETSRQNCENANEVTPGSGMQPHGPVASTTNPAGPIAPRYETQPLAEAHTGTAQVQADPSIPQSVPNDFARQIASNQPTEKTKAAPVALEAQTSAAHPAAAARPEETLASATVPHAGFSTDLPFRTRTHTAGQQ